MSGGRTRKTFLALASFAVCLLLASSAGAAVVNPNCAILNGGGGNDIKISPSVVTGGSKLHVDATDDVVLTCALDGATVVIEAHSITVDKTGANTGGIHTTGKDGIKLYATGNKDKCSDASPLGATIRILAAVLQDDNDNGGITFYSCGDITMNQGASLTSKGATIRGECLYPDDPSTTPWCRLTAENVTFFGNRIELDSKGDQTHTNVVATTIGPRDLHTYISYFGSLLAGNNCPQALPPGTCIPIDQACQFCQECHNHNSYSGEIESNFFGFGEQDVDFSDACIHIAENITITADGRSPVSPYPIVAPTLGPGNLYYINLQNAEIRDDFGKTGFISITALPPLVGGTPHPPTPGEVPFLPPGAGYTCSPTWFGTGNIWYDQVVLVDEGKNGGGDDPQAVSFMNGCRYTTAGDCAPVALHCDPTPIPHHGVVADPGAPNGRGGHFVFGIPRCDS